MSDTEHELDPYVADFERAYRAADGALDDWLEDAHAQVVRPPVMECSFLFIDHCYHVVVHVAAAQCDGLFGGKLHVRVDRTFAVVECTEDVHLIDAGREVHISDPVPDEVGVITGLVDAGSVVQVGIRTSDGQFLWLCADGNLFRRIEREYVESRHVRAPMIGVSISFERTDWGGLRWLSVEEDA